MRKIAALVRNLGRPGVLNAALKWRPYSISAHELMRQLTLHGVCPDTVIDVGANQGQFARAILETFPECSLYSFEPLAAASAVYRRNILERRNVLLTQSAVGSKDGETNFHEDAYSLASSVLEPMPDQSIRFPNTGSTSITSVPICRLDTFFSDKDVSPPVLLKLDVQGYELEALLGAEKFIAGCEWVLTEVSYQPLYKGEPAFARIDAHLLSRGFTLVAPLASLRDAQDRIVQSDLLYRRIP